MAKGQFDLNDLRSQLHQMQRMGGLGALAGMLPGMEKIKQAIDDSGVLDGKVLGRLDAIIGSMTPKERGQARAAQRQAQDPRRQGLRHHRAGRQQAAQDAPGNVRPR